MPARAQLRWVHSDDGPAGRVDAVASDSSGVTYALTPDGIFRAANDGGRWIRASGTGGRDILHRFVVASDGRLVAGGVSEGALGSSDGGATWLRGASWPAGHSLHDLAAHPAQTELLAATDRGLLRSTDGGDAWSPVGSTASVRRVTILSDGMALAATGSLVVASRDASRERWETILQAPGELVYDIIGTHSGAIIATLSAGAVLRSTDGGATWESVTGGVPRSPIVELTPAPAGEILMSSITGHVATSLDDGASWTVLDSLPHSAIHRTASGRLLAASVTGIVVSDDNGTTWKTSDSGITSAVVAAITAIPNGAVYALQTTGRLHRSDDMGMAWIDEPGLLASRSASYLSSTSMAVDSVTGDLYVATPRDGLLRTTDGGTSWEPIADVPMSVESVSMLADGRIAVGSAHFLYLSSDHGTTWSVIEALPEGFPILATLSEGAALNVASSAGLFRSEDEGLTWVRVHEGVFYTIAAGSGRLFAGSDNRILTSEDGGVTWSEALDAGRSFFWRIATARDGSVAAGLRNGGVYLSRDGGSTWEQANEGLANLRITALSYLPDGRVALGTDGGGIYRSAERVASVERTSDAREISLDITPTLGGATLHATLPTRAHLRITLFDARGALVETLCDDVRDGGAHRFTVGALTSGVYTCVMRAGTSVVIARVIVVR